MVDCECTHSFVRGETESALLFGFEEFLVSAMSFSRFSVLHLLASRERLQSLLITIVAVPKHGAPKASFVQGM